MAYNTGNQELDNLLTFMENNFGIVTSPADIERWKADLNGSGTRPRDMEQLRKDIIEFRVGDDNLRQWAADNGIAEGDIDVTVQALKDGTTTFKAVRTGEYKPDVATTDETPPGEDQDSQGVGRNPEEGDEDLTILRGKEMKWYYDRNTGKWFVEYGLPGSDRSLVFEASPEQMDALFGEGRRPKDYEETTQKELLGRENVTFGENISEMHGTGQFEDEVERIIALALDEGRLPEWVKEDPAVLDALYIAQAEGKSDEWLLEQIAKTDGFNTRFPDIKSFQAIGNLTLGEAITGFLEMEAGVRAAVKASGLDAESVTPEVVGGLLKAGHSLDVVNKTVSGFKRLQDFKPALEAFNSILAQQGLKPLTTLDEMLEFMEGKASSEVYDIWEASSLAESAAAAGLGDLFSAEDAMNAALSGNHTLETATSAMQQAAKLLLRMRHEVAVGKYGLDHEELIDVSLGQPPRSGRSVAEVQESINRAVGAAQGNLKSRAKTFTSFDKSGTPQAASLRRARQEE